MNKPNGSSGLLMGILVGAAVGAGVALLYAPCSGEEARKFLTGKLKGLTDGAEDVAEEGRQTVKRHVKKLASQVHKPEAV